MDLQIPWKEYSKKKKSAESKSRTKLKIPPHSNCGRAVLYWASMLICSRRLGNKVAELKVNDERLLRLVHNQIIFRCHFYELCVKCKPNDLITFLKTLEERNGIENCGWFLAYLGEAFARNSAPCREHNLALSRSYQRARLLFENWLGWLMRLAEAGYKSRRSTQRRNFGMAENSKRFLKLAEKPH